MMVCKFCNSKSVKEFVYGYFPSNINKDQIPGGCVVSDISPRYYCENCDETFGLLGKFYMMYQNDELVAILSKTSISSWWSLYDLKLKKIGPDIKTEFPSKEEATAYLSQEDVVTDNVWVKATKDKEDIIINTMETFYNKLFPKHQLSK